MAEDPGFGLTGIHSEGGVKTGGLAYPPGTSIGGEIGTSYEV